MLGIDAVFDTLGIYAENIVPIGNHELKRHWVYGFRSNNRDQVIKIYYKERRLERELEAFKVLGASGIPMAELIAHGRLQDERPYMIVSKLPGVLLSKQQLSQADAIIYYAAMGDILGRMHSVPYKQENEPLQQQLDRYAKEAMSAIETGHMPLEDKKVLNHAYETYRLWMQETDYAQAHFGFCHNDFDSRNILVKGYEISGIIDFEGAGYGYTENDLLNLHRKVFTTSTNLEKVFFQHYSRHVTFDHKAYLTRLKVNLLRDVLENCSWAFDQARSYYEENLHYLKTHLL